MNTDDVLGKSRELDRFLEKATRELMPITDAEPLLSISDLIADVKAAKNEFRQGIQRELKGMAADIRANATGAILKVQAERKSVRDEFEGLLGNEIVDTSVDHTKSDDPSGA